MLRKITLKNFMSHAETVVELAEGLTVLTGPNNCGKSAIVAALQTIASNGRTKHVTRHGEKVASVTVETSDGDSVCWERKGNTVKYVINGEDIHRVGQSIPDRLHDVLQLDRVDLGTGKTDDRYDIHFGEQKSPVFLLGDTGRRAAEFFASSSDVSRLMEMQALHRNEIREKKQAKKRLEQISARNVARLSALSPVQSIVEDVSRAESLANEIREVAGQCEKLRDLVDAIKNKKAECRSLAEASATLAQLDRANQTPVDLRRDRDHIDQLSKKTDLIKARTRSINRLSREMEALDELKTLPPIEPAARCQVLLDRIKTTNRAISELGKTSNISERLVAPPEFQSVSGLRGLLNRIRETGQSVTSLELSNQSLDQLAELNPPEDANRLTELIAELKKLGDTRKKIAAKHDIAKSDLRQCKVSIEAFIQSNPKCGVCGGDLDPEEVMSVAIGSHNHSFTQTRANNRRPK